MSCVINALVNVFTFPDTVEVFYPETPYFHIWRLLPAPGQQYLWIHITPLPLSVKMVLTHQFLLSFGFHARLSCQTKCLITKPMIYEYLYYTNHPRKVYHKNWAVFFTHLSCEFWMLLCSYMMPKTT